MRVGGGAYWRNDNWFVRMGLIHVFGQKDLAVNETPTAGYNLLRMEISSRRYYQYSPWGPTEMSIGWVPKMFAEAGATGPSRTVSATARRGESRATLPASQIRRKR